MKNKENTKRKLLNAVGQVIRNYGLNGIGVNKVANCAKVSKILIYRYFGSFDQLMNTYILEKNFWTNCPEGDAAALFRNTAVQDQVKRILKDRFVIFYEHCEMEAMLINHFSNKNNKIKYIVRNRHFASRNACSGIISALLAAGTDHLLFSSPVKEYAGNETHHCDDQVALLQSMEQIVDWAFG